VITPELFRPRVIERGTEVSVPAQIQRWAEEQPQMTAIAYSDGLLTYAELYARSSDLAEVLRLHGVGRGSVVALALERSPELVVAALAVWLAGGAYLGTDVDDPDVRLSAIVADSGASVVVTRAKMKQRFPRDNAHVLAIEDVLAQDVPVAAQVEAAPEDVCYVTYTSGSTGTPKGVLVPHRGLTNLVSWYGEAFGVRPGERITQFARPSFDAWALEVWPCLAGGGTLCLVQGRLPNSPPDLVEWLVAERITICFMTTALAAEMFNQSWPQSDVALRVVLLGGEKLYRYPPAGFPGQVFNLYGPTEGTVVATYAELIPGPSSDRTPPIGWPLPNTRAYVLDQGGRPVPPGTIGELYIGGRGVALGYLNRPELTADRFPVDPFAPGDDARMYATGDLVRELPDGSLDFTGRADGQVKLRGFRIELGEVEAAMNQLAEVREAAVVKQAGAERLVGYVVAADATRRPEPRQLRRELEQRLPDYMVPHTITFLDSLPLTPHGKVDREGLAARPQLPQPQSQPPQPQSQAQPQLSSSGAGDNKGESDSHAPLEQIIAELWSEVLEIGSVDREDSFFDLGGDSLQAMRFVSRARERGIRLGPEALFEHEVLHELAAAIPASSAGGR
jgi:amino acid adenylation domain-containing protein